MKPLTDILYTISNAMLVPAIVALLLLLTWILVLAGGFLKELFERRHVRATLRAAVAAARQIESEVMPVWEIMTAARNGLPRRFVEFVGRDIANKQVLTQALVTLENEVASSLARVSFITRVSPMLGLMGTLIPLGPALAGLAAGNMQSLAGNLIVAFTATVVGLLTSSLAYGLGLVRRTWYSHDLTDLEFIAREVAVKEDPHVASAQEVG